MIIKQHDRQRGTWVYDCGEYRGIVYKVGSQWYARVGVRSGVSIAPDDSLVRVFRLRGQAEAFTREWLEARTQT